MIRLWHGVGTDSSLNGPLEHFHGVVSGLRNQKEETNRVGEKPGRQKQDTTCEDECTFYDLIGRGNALTQILLDFSENGKPLVAHQVSTQDSGKDDENDRI
jgi:hypothetical protein